MTPTRRTTMRRLATLWLICAVVGFTVAAGAALMISFCVDGHAHFHAPIAAMADPKLAR